MYLTCPHCQTVYTVRAAMLREGQGEVRCGACHTLFNALDYLSDDLPEALPPVPEEVAHDGLTDSPAGDALQESEQPATSEPAEQPELARVEPSADEAIADNAIPEALAQDWQSTQYESGSGSRNLGLMSLAVIALLGLVVQYVWFAPEDLVARFPQAAAAVERFCGMAGCPAPERRDPSLIRILSREVRAHPRYEGALLVSATFSNVAPWPQPYPRLRFQLYDVNGQTIASRVFSPSQYLAGALPAQSLLPPGQPLQVALEMLAPEQASVSFEFSFL